MKNNKLSGLIIGGVLGFVFVITCTSPVVSEENESANVNGRYAISTHVQKEGSTWYYHEITTDTQTGEVVSRKVDDGGNMYINQLFVQIDN